MRLSILAVPVAVALVLGACGGSGGSNVSPIPAPNVPTPTPTVKPGPTFLYVHDGANQILAHAMDFDTGALSLRSVTEGRSGRPGFGLLAARGGRVLLDFLDVTDCCHSPVDSELRTYEIAADGTLRLSEATRLPITDPPRSPVASAGFLYFLSSNYSPLTVYARPLGPGNGGGVFAAGNIDFPTGMAVSPTERVLYSTGITYSPDVAVVKSYTLEPDGLGHEARSDRVESDYLTLSRSIAVHPSGRFLYVVVEEMDHSPRSVGAQIRIYATDDTGRLDPVGSVPAKRGQMLLHPNGRFLFLARSSEIDVYGVDDRSPFLTLLYRTNGGDDPVPTGSGYVMTMAQDPSGRFLYGVGQGIWAYAVDPQSGALRYLGKLAPDAVGTPVIVSPRAESPR